MTDSDLLNFQMTIEQKIFFWEFCDSLDDTGTAYYAFVDGYDPPRYDIQWFIDRNLIQKSDKPPETDGINRYFPKYAYELTGMGRLLYDNPKYIEVVDP